MARRQRVPCVAAESEVLRRSLQTRFLLYLVGDVFVTVELEFARSDYLEILRSVFVANGWAHESSRPESPTVMRIHRVVRRGTNFLDPAVVEREVRSMVSGVPNPLRSCEVLIGAATAQEPEWEPLTLVRDGSRLFQAHARAEYRMRDQDLVAEDEGPFEAPGESRRSLWITLLLCGWTTFAFALLPTQFVPFVPGRGVDVVIPAIAVCVVFATLAVWAATRWIARTQSRQPLAPRFIDRGSLPPRRILDIVQPAAVGAVVGLGIGEVYAYHSAGPESVPHVFLIAATVLLLVVVGGAAAGVSIAVRVYRSRAGGFALGAALLVALGATVIRVPSWAFFSGMGVPMFSTDLDWPSATILAVPFLVAVAVSAIILVVAWVVRRSVHSVSMRLMLQAVCIAGIVASLASSLGASFVDGRDILATKTTASTWAGYPHPVCLAGETYETDEPYWLMLTTGSAIVVITRHVPGVDADPEHVSIEQRASGTTPLRFVDPTDGCAE